MTEIVEYKIFNPTNNMFSAGGSHLDSLWSKKGKVWRGLGPLKNHFRMLEQNGQTCQKILESYRQDGCYVVKSSYRILEDGVEQIHIDQFI